MKLEDSSPWSGSFLAGELVRIPEAHIPWVRHHQERIAQRLATDPDLCVLVSALPQVPLPVQEAILDCLGPTVAHKCPDIAWDLALLQIDRANHRGDTAQAEVWHNLTIHHEARVCRLDDGPRYILLREVIQTMSRFHNGYAFPHPLPLTSSGREALEELEAQWQRRRQRLGESACIVLGQYYGTLGQHSSSARNGPRSP